MSGTDKAVTPAEQGQEFYLSFPVPDTREGWKQQAEYLAAEYNKLADRWSEQHDRAEAAAADNRALVERYAERCRGEADMAKRAAKEADRNRALVEALRRIPSIALAGDGQYIDRLETVAAIADEALETVALATQEPSDG
jgi:hypothetical protein